MDIKGDGYCKEMVVIIKWSTVIKCNWQTETDRR